MGEGLLGSDTSTGLLWLSRRITLNFTEFDKQVLEALLLLLLLLGSLDLLVGYVCRDRLSIGVCLLTGSVLLRCAWAENALRDLATVCHDMPHAKLLLF